MARPIEPTPTLEDEDALWFIQNLSQTGLDKTTSEAKVGSGRISRWKIAPPLIKLKGKGLTASGAVIAERRESLR